MNGKQEYRMGTGTTSMLMIFVVLAMTTLSILSLSSAQADLTMTRRNVEMVAMYYDAAAAAQDNLAAIDAALAVLRAQATGPEDYAATVSELQIPGEFLHYISTDSSVQFSLDAGNGRALEVEVEITPYDSDGARYVLSRHQLVNDSQWKPESDLVIFGG